MSQADGDRPRRSSAKKSVQIVPTLALLAVVLLGTWMGNSNGGYFTGEWAAVALILGALVLLTSLAGVSGTWSRWSAAASVLFVAYADWTLLSLLWSPNRGDAWAGSGLTLLYLLVFWLTVALVGVGASRRWVFAASVLGPAVVAAFTLPAVAPRLEDFFVNYRLIGSVGYFNGEAAFLLVPFWTGIYLAGSRRVNPALRGLVLGGIVLCVSVAVLTQSRGAMVAMAASLPVYFLISGQRLRGFLALAPVVAALFITFPALNEVYVAFLKGGAPETALHKAAPLVWQAAAGAGVYGALWGIADRLWKPPEVAARALGAVVLAGVVIALFLGAIAFQERVGNPVSWTEQKWEAFKANDTSGKQQSRFLSASGSGRYTLWEVAWKDFVSHPVLGVGTQNYEATYYQRREANAGFVRQPHSLPLEVLAERGVVGGVLFFGILITCVASGLWRRFRSLNTEGKAQTGALLAAIAYWFVHSSADWFWQLPAVTLPAMVYLAMLVAPWRTNRGTELPGWSLRLTGATIAVLAMVAVAPLYVAAYYLERSDEEANPRAALQDVERAEKFNPVDPDLRQHEAELALRAGDPARAEKAYSEAIRLNPEHYAPYELSAALHEQMGERKEALSLYKKASKLNPLDEELDQRIKKLQAEPADDKQ